MGGGNSNLIRRTKGAMKEKTIIADSVAVTE